MSLFKEKYVTPLYFIIKMMKEPKNFTLLLDTNDNISFFGSIIFDNKYIEEITFKLYEDFDLKNGIYNILLTYGVEAKLNIKYTDDCIEVVATKVKRNELSSAAKRGAGRCDGIYFSRIISKNGIVTDIIFSYPNLNGYMHVDDRPRWLNVVRKEISKNIPEKYIRFENYKNELENDVDKYFNNIH